MTGVYICFSKSNKAHIYQNISHIEYKFSLREYDTLFNEQTHKGIPTRIIPIWNKQKDV